jgi:5-methylcytosine-specific restriction endonuclease McrA
VQTSPILVLSESKRRWAGAKVSRGEYAKRRRIALCKELSPDGKCARCGERFEHAKLTIDHADGVTWAMKRLSRWSRVAMYWREHKNGISLRALCGRCNSSEGQKFRGRRRWS